MVSHSSASILRASKILYSSVRETESEEELVPDDLDAVLSTFRPRLPTGSNPITDRVVNIFIHSS